MSVAERPENTMAPQFVIDKVASVIAETARLTLAAKEHGGEMFGKLGAVLEDLSTTLAAIQNDVETFEKDAPEDVEMALLGTMCVLAVTDKFLSATPAPKFPSPYAWRDMTVGCLVDLIKEIIEEVDERLVSAEELVDPVTAPQMTAGTSELTQFQFQVRMRLRRVNGIDKPIYRRARDREPCRGLDLGHGS
jgi:hypothetical protein